MNYQEMAMNVIGIVVAIIVATYIQKNFIDKPTV